MRMLRGCPDCGAMWREPTARFCGRCGARLVEQSETSTRGGSGRSLRLQPRPVRVVAGLAIIGLVVAALAWAASRPPRIQQIDVAVPAPTELQAPPDRRGELPRCVVDGLEQDCVTWQLDARTTGVQRHGKLLVILRRDGLVQAVSPSTGDVVWSTGTPIVEGSLFDSEVPGRIVVVGHARGDERIELLDAGSGRTLGTYSGWLVASSRDRFALVSDFDQVTGVPIGPTLLVDLVSGQVDEWELEPFEYVADVTGPILTVVAPPDSSPTSLRARDEYGELLWSVEAETWPVAVGDFVHTISISEGDGVRSDAVLRTLDPQTGETVWSRSLSGQIRGDLALVHGSLIATEGDEVLSMDPASGVERWRAPAPAPNVFPHPVELPGAVVLSAWTEDGRSQLVAVDADTGRHLWTGPTLENQWWDPSRITDDGLLSSSGSEFSIDHYDGTVTSFVLTSHPTTQHSAIVSLEPLVVSTGNRIYGIDADIALGGQPRPRASE